MGPLQGLLERLAPLSDGTPRGDLREALGLCAGLLAILTVAKPLLDGALGMTGAAFTLAAAWQLFIPLDRMDRRGLPSSAYGIHVHGMVGAPLRWCHARLAFRARRTRSAVARRLTHVLAPYTRGARFNPRGAARETALLLAACAVTFPPFVVGYVLFQQWLAARNGMAAQFSPTPPPDALTLVASNLFLVAFTEEIFFRGYIHTLLVRAWPPRFTVWGASMGRAVLVGSALFALGHFAGEWNFTRLGPFFPALLFCALRSAGGGLLAAITYHAACNVLGEVMRVSVSWH